MKTFSFNAEVAMVFDDMVERSVPFYHNILHQVAQIAAKFYVPDTIIYDLGCSTGALVPWLQQTVPLCRYVGMDASPDMLTLAAKHASKHVTFQQQDLLTLSLLPNASVIICNLVLQFLPVHQRATLVQQYYDALPKGGAFIIVEKLTQSNADLQALYQASFRQFKASNQYSIEEIQRKEAALEHVLIPETHAYYSALLTTSGFATHDTFFKWYNFAGYVGIKT